MAEGPLDVNYDQNSAFFASIYLNLLFNFIKGKWLKPNTRQIRLFILSVYLPQPLNIELPLLPLSKVNGEISNHR